MRYNDFTVILPTLNEEKSIDTLANKLLRSYKGIKVIVVDDGSTDGTREKVRDMMKSRKEIGFMERAGRGLQKGLTASVIDGIKRVRTRYFVVMDADLQHPPGLIKEMARGKEDGYDLVVAVRNNVENWELGRKMISKALIGVGYALLSATGKETSSDIFSGYFCMGRDDFLRVYNKNRNRFVMDGFKVLYDFLKCNDKGRLRVMEVPYVFANRRWGSSKAGFRQGLALLRSFVT